MKKKGFTLIEMIGILVILSLIVVLSVPTITSMLKKQNQKKYEDWLTNLYMAAEEYVETHREEFYEVNAGGTSYLSLQMLLDNGYLKSTVKEPTTGEAATKVGIIEVKQDTEKILKYKYVLIKDLGAIALSVGYKPDAADEPWTSKDVVITAYATTSPGIHVSEFSFDGGKTWQTSNKKTVQANGTWKVVARDKRFDKRSNVVTAIVKNIDKTAPTVAKATINLVTTKDITVNAVCEDSESGIRGYRFSKDGGANWTAEQTNKSYKFDDLKSDNYNIKVKCYNKAGLEKVSEPVTQKTEDIPVPTCTLNPSTGWTTSKTATIDWGKVPENSKLTWQYQVYSGVAKDGSTDLKNGEWITSTSQTKDITMSPVAGTSNGSIIIKTTDGVNTQTGSTCNIAYLDIDKPTCTLTLNKTSIEPNLELTVNYSDKIGKVATNGYSWTSATSGFGSEKTKTITSNGTYNVWVKDQAGNVGTCSKNVSNIASQYTITYNLNGGTNNASNPSIYYSGKGSTLYNPTKTGYTFQGWYTDSALTKQITSIPTTQTGNVTLYAKWSINSYTVTFKNGTTTLKTQTVNYGVAATSPANPTKSCYTFTGWDKTFSKVTSNLTVNAVFKINTYTVTFVNGLGTTLKTQTVNCGGSATAPANPTRTGYAFNGWSGTYTNVTSNRTITATWKDNTPPACPTISMSGGSTTTWKSGTTKVWYTNNSDIAKMEWFTNNNASATSTGTTYTSYGFKSTCTSSSTSTCTFTGSGLRRGIFRVYDAAGNYRDCYTATYKVDNVKPTISCSITTDKSKKRWNYKTTNSVPSGTRYHKVVVSTYATATYPTLETGYGTVYNPTSNPWFLRRTTKLTVKGTSVSNSGIYSNEASC